MKTVAFVPVRLSSSRLPEKHFKLIGDSPLLSWVLKRLKNCREIDEIVVCSPLEPESEKLKEFCKKEEVKLFIYEGDVNDVVGRLTAAACTFNADICVLASGDCPLLCSQTIDKLVQLLRRSPDCQRAYIKTKNGKQAIHEGIMVARREVWEFCDRFSDTPELREHQLPVINVYPDKFSHLKACGIEDEEIFYSLNHRISVDTPSDLEFMNRVFEELYKEGKDFNLEEVIKLLKEKPYLMKINEKVERKGLKDKSLKALIFVSAVLNYGYGNLIRALEVAKKLVNKGIGVRFAVLDEEAKTLCEENYFKGTIVKDYRKLEKFLKNFDLFIFDINSTMEIEREFVEKLKKEKKKVVFIDNVNGGALSSDLIIIPTAHYIGRELPNLVWGAEYVVIRKEVLNLSKKKHLKNGIIARVDEPYQEVVRKLWKNIKFVKSFSDSFPNELASSSIFISHLGISCYEALYLDIPVIVIPRRESELREIEKFLSFSISEGKNRLGNGGEKIARKIKELLNG
ncbi:MAG: NTP transferase domain-containing protein [Desulfonauticus sp.]|nr:NTP transferase domain-containing protein [Desulfonauticus sp.]